MAERITKKSASIIQCKLVFYTKDNATKELKKINQSDVSPNITNSGNKVFIDNPKPVKGVQFKVKALVGKDWLDSDRNFDLVFTPDNTTDSKY